MLSTPYSVLGTVYAKLVELAVGTTNCVVGSKTTGWETFFRIYCCLITFSVEFYALVGLLLKPIMCFYTVPVLFVLTRPREKSPPGTGTRSNHRKGNQSEDFAVVDRAGTLSKWSLSRNQWEACRHNLQNSLIFRGEPRQEPKSSINPLSITMMPRTDTADSVKVAQAAESKFFRRAAVACLIGLLFLSASFLATSPQAGWQAFSKRRQFHHRRRLLFLRNKGSGSDDINEDDPPTVAPMAAPSTGPTAPPTAAPTNPPPTTAPSTVPSVTPTNPPPSADPSTAPSAAPSASPSAGPGTWVKSSYGDSCDEACEDTLLPCNVNSMNSVDRPKRMTRLASILNDDCDNVFDQDTHDVYPAVSDKGVCGYLSVGSNSSCTARSKRYRRYCCCGNVDCPIPRKKQQRGLATKRRPRVRGS